MQKFLYTLCFCLLTIYSSCQITGFGYQGAARDVSGHVIASTQLTLRFSLLEGSVTGAEVYVETQATMTNLQGVFTATVGNGVGVSGNFNSVNWATSKFLKVEISIAGAAYVLAGTTQILSAPTAYYAQKAKQLDTSTNIDAGNKNVVNMANPIAAQDAVTKNYVDAQIANDNDKSATNEIQNLDAVLAVSNSAGSKKITNLLDPTLAQDAATKSYVDGLIILDNDKNATNEIQDLSLVGGALKITNNLSATQINLAPFLGTNTDEQNLDNVLAFGNSAGSKKITNLLDPTVAQDAATKNYVDTQIAADAALDNDKSVTNEIQNLDNVLTVNNSAGSKKITNLLDPTVAQDAATKNYVDTQIATDAALDNDKSATNEIQDLDAVLDINNSAGSNRIINLMDPSGSQDAATKNYVDTRDALGWIQSGNTIADPATQFIGTTNAQPITFRSNNIERMRLSSSGNLGIGTNNPLQLLHVKPNNTPSDIDFDDTVLDSFAEVSLGSVIESNSNNASNGNGGFASILTSSGGSSAKYGIIGVSKGATSANSTGVLASSSGSTAYNRGLYGRATGSSAAAGSYAIGIQSIASGTTYEAYSGDFNATSTATLRNVGIYAGATGSAPESIGVFGRALNGTTGNKAGYFEKTGTEGTNNYGVQAIAEAGPSGTTRGGYFEVTNNNGTGSGHGLWARSSGTGSGFNTGIQAEASGGSTQNKAGYFYKWGTAGTQNYGIQVRAEAGLSGFTYGGNFSLENNNGTGMGYGLYASINGTGSGQNTGIRVEASGGSVTYGGYFNATGSSHNRAIYATASGGATNIAGEFVGDVTISQKATIGQVMRLTPVTNANTPASPSEGDIYYDAEDHVVKYWNGSTWVTM